MWPLCLPSKIQNRLQKTDRKHRTTNYYDQSQGWHAWSKSTQKQGVLVWEVVHKVCIYDCFIWNVTEFHIPHFQIWLSHTSLILLTTLFTHCVWNTVLGSRNTKMNKIHSLISRDPSSSTIILSHDPWLPVHFLRVGIHVFNSQIACSFISQVF